MRSDSIPLPDPVRTGPKSKRARILMPIALAVAALAVFLLLFWPPDHGGKGSRGHSGRSGEGQGSSSTRNGSSPVGGGDSRGSSSPKGESWWYKEKEDKPEKSADGWWYKDEPEGSGSKKEAGKSSRSPVGGQ